MKQKQFLTVMAVLDDDTQKTMDGLQKRIIALGAPGTQTMGIPFHISLGSFPVEKEHEVLRAMRETSGKTTVFSVMLTGLDTFSDRVLFLRPEMNYQLAALHQPFDCAFADGYPWTPHATLFCGETEEVRRAKKEIEGMRLPIFSRVTALELGRFFPAQFISRMALLPEGKAGKEVCKS